MLKVDYLLKHYDSAVKRFLLLTLIQQSGEATMDDVHELTMLRRQLYKATEGIVS